MQSLPSIATLTRQISTISSDITNSAASNISRSVLIQALDCSSVSMVICGVDEDRTIIYVNNAFTIQSGYSKNEAIGTPYSMLGYQSDLFPDIHLAFDQTQDVLIAATGRKKDGDPMPAKLRISPVLDAFGSVYAFIIVKTVPVF